MSYLLLVATEVIHSYVKATHSHIKLGCLKNNAILLSLNTHKNMVYYIGMVTS